MEIGKKYKIILKQGTIYTAKVISKNNTFIEIIDIKETRIGINVDSISHYKEIQGEKQ